MQCNTPVKSSSSVMSNLFLGITLHFEFIWGGGGRNDYYHQYPEKLESSSSELNLHIL